MNIDNYIFKTDRNKQWKHYEEWFAEQERSEKLNKVDKNFFFNGFGDDTGSGDIDRSHAYKLKLYPNRWMVGVSILEIVQI